MAQPNQMHHDTYNAKTPPRHPSTPAMTSAPSHQPTLSPATTTTTTTPTTAFAYNLNSIAVIFIFIMSISNNNYNRAAATAAPAHTPHTETSVATPATSHVAGSVVDTSVGVLNGSCGVGYGAGRLTAQYSPSPTQPQRVPLAWRMTRVR